MYSEEDIFSPSPKGSPDHAANPYAKRSSTAKPPSRPSSGSKQSGAGVGIAPMSSRSESEGDVTPRAGENPFSAKHRDAGQGHGRRDDLRINLPDIRSSPSSQDGERLSARSSGRRDDGERDRGHRLDESSHSHRERDKASARSNDERESNHLTPRLAPINLGASVGVAGLLSARRVSSNSVSSLADESYHYSAPLNRIGSRTPPSDGLQRSIRVPAAEEEARDILETDDWKCRKCATVNDVIDYPDYCSQCATKRLSVFSNGAVPSAPTAARFPGSNTAPRGSHKGERKSNDVSATYTVSGDSWNCPKCGTPNETDAAYCIHCAKVRHNVLNGTVNLRKTVRRDGI